MDPILKEFLDKLRARAQSRKTRNPFGYGISTAASYLSHFARCAGDEVCAAHLESQGASCTDWDSAVKAAEDRPVYCSDDLTIDEKSVVTNSSDFKSVLKGDDIEIPPRTIMVFRNVITTPRIDRDGDILRTDGAQPDPKMPLLWQHMHAMPVGKMLQVIDHTKNVLRVASAVIDSPLGNDVAQLIEFGALRISHGFLPKKFKDLDMDPTDEVPWPGFDILKFEIMEESVVSVPSNVEAAIEAFSRGKLADPAVKAWAKHFADERPPQVAASVQIKSGRVIVPSESKDLVTIWRDDEGVTVQLETESSDPSDVANADGNRDSESEQATGSQSSDDGKTGCGCQNGGEEVVEVSEASTATAVKTLVAAETELGDVLASIDDDLISNLIRSAIARIQTVRNTLTNGDDGQEPDTDTGGVPSEESFEETTLRLILAADKSDSDSLTRVANAIQAVASVKEREERDAKIKTALKLFA